MKYEFEYVKKDNYVLKYKSISNEEKEIPFIIDIEIVSKIQGIDKKARLLMFKELTKEGITKDDLVVVKKLENGKTIYDESNYKAYEEEYMQIARLEVINEIYTKLFGMGYTQLLVDMGVDDKTDPNDVQRFSEKLSLIILGNEEKSDDEKSPSEEEK